MALDPTPQMSLTKPEPSVTPGPEWAQTLNAAIDAIDSHDHSPGKGKRIGTAGLNIDADLEFNGHDATELRSVRLNEQGAILADSLDKSCLYSKDGNLYWNNAGGASVQVTAGTAVNNSVSGAISSAAPGAYPYSVTASDAQRVLLVDTSSARTINLPAATTAVAFWIKDRVGSSASNNISVVPNGTDTIDGVNTTRRLAEAYGVWMFVSDGISNWTVAGMLQEIPAGSLQMFAGAAAPAGWLLCNGAAVSRTTYARLWTAIGATFGAGDGSTTFNLPDLRQRFPLGIAASGTGNALGATGGAIDHTHSVPAHHHAMGTGADLNVTSSGAHTHSIDHDHGSVTSGAGSPHSHTITDPGHAHSQVVTTISGSGTAVRADYAADATTGNQFAQGVNTGSSTTGITVNNESAHTHSVDLPNFTGTSGSTSHTHPSGNIAGRIGLVTGGVDGNAAMTSGAANPPFIALNFIIKA